MLRFVDGVDSSPLRCSIGMSPDLSTFTILALCALQHVRFIASKSAKYNTVRLAFDMACFPAVCRWRADPIHGRALDLLGWLRSKGAGLPKNTPGRKVKVWREGGTNAAPTWEVLNVDGWEASDKTVQQVGIGHGDVLVVQEHPDCLPYGLPTAVEWIGTQQSRR